MSVLIKGMDMPSSCADCQGYVNNGNTCWCVLIDKDIYDKGKRDEDCPLVEVKAPHGGLIDADALITQEKLNVLLETGEYEFIKEKLTKDELWKLMFLAYSCMNEANEIPSAQPEIIRCGECVNNFDNRCLQADHHTNDIECCMSVFGAKRRTDE